MNFTGQVASFASGSYTVTRRGPTLPGSDGRADLATAETFPVTASVQPLSGRDLQRLPEGLRKADRQKIYVTVPLQVIGAPDVISIAGEDWEVEGCLDWSVLGAYYKYFIAKVGN